MIIYDTVIYIYTQFMAKLWHIKGYDWQNGWVKWFYGTGIPWLGTKRRNHLSLSLATRTGRNMYKPEKKTCYKMNHTIYMIAIKNVHFYILVAIKKGTIPSIMVHFIIWSISQAIFHLVIWYMANWKMVHFIDSENLPILKMLMFHSYVKLPAGMVGYQCNDIGSISDWTPTVFGWYNTSIWVLVTQPQSWFLHVSPTC